MKKNILSLAIVLGLSFVSISSFAQRPKLFGGTHLPKELGLTKDQHLQVQQLNKDYRSKVLEIRSDSLIPKADRGNRMQELRKQHDADIQKLLTVEQSAKWDKMRNKKPSFRDNQGLRSLGLTDNQKKEMEALNKELKDKRNAISSQADLSQADKKAKMTEMYKEHKASVDKILTVEQQAKLKDRKPGEGRMIAGKDLRGQSQRQQWTKQRNMAHMPNKSIFDNLNLTAEQKQKIKSVNEDFGEKREKLSSQHRAALNEVLTPEQQTKLKERQSKIEKKTKRGDNDRPSRKDMNKAKDKA